MQNSLPQTSPSPEEQKVTDTSSLQPSSAPDTFSREQSERRKKKTGKVP